MRVRVICIMEDLMVQLETARQERVQTLKEFMRSKMNWHVRNADAMSCAWKMAN